MRFDVLTLFPDFIKNGVSISILKRAQEKGVLEVLPHDIREFAEDKHGTVDDTPYGGGAGMVLKVDVIHKALTSVTDQIETLAGPRERRRVILLTPQGKRFTQEVAQTYADSYDQITLICGHYEGFDERIRSYVDEELSIGDFVLTGGELPALTVIDAVSRLREGVIDKASPHEETFSLKDSEGNRLHEYPHYTRPLTYDGQTVPDILLSGNHGAIATWRLEQAIERTKKRQEDSRA